MLNHPTFRDQNRTITDRTSGFLVSYVGWGCLDSVVLTIQRKNGERDKWVVNACQLLAKSGARSEMEPSPAEAAALARAGEAALPPEPEPAPEPAPQPSGPERGQGGAAAPPALEQVREKEAGKLPVPVKRPMPPGPR